MITFLLIANKAVSSLFGTFLSGICFGSYTILDIAIKKTGEVSTHMVKLIVQLEVTENNQGNHRYKGSCCEDDKQDGTTECWRVVIYTMGL